MAGGAARAERGQRQSLRPRRPDRPRRVQQSDHPHRVERRAHRRAGRGSRGEKRLPACREVTALPPWASTAPAAALPSTQGSSFNSDHSGEGGIAAVSLQWLLFDIGERTAVLDARQAERRWKCPTSPCTAAHQQLIYAVSLAFYTHAAAQARVATATPIVRRRPGRCRRPPEDRYKRGVGTVIEVAQARQADRPGEAGAGAGEWRRPGRSISPCSTPWESRP